MTGKTLRVNSDIPGEIITPSTPPPKDYPFDPSPDEFSAEVFDTSYKSRRETLLAHIRRNPAPNNQKAPWYELARLFAGGNPHLGIIQSAFEQIEQRQDGADALLNFVLRLVYQFNNYQALPAGVLLEARQLILDFKYWPDEPGVDAMTYWTESHYVLFAAAGFLAGQLYPDQIFTSSGQSGQALREASRARLIEWMNLRFFTGFSEWLSNIYYDDQLTALVNLVEFSQDEEINQRATILIDLLLLDMVLNHYQGVFGSTHGRSFGESNKWAELESTTDTFKLLFGKGIFSISDNSSAISFALSNAYQVPQVLFEISNDQLRSEMLNRQRIGIQLDQADWWGLKHRNLEDLMQLLTLEGYFHPRVINLFHKMARKYNWWENSLFQPLQRRRGLFNFLYTIRLLPTFARLFEEDLSRTTREQVNLYTYRTPDYMLSSAQDYRQGSGGHQQHVWQASLGHGAVCFTTHPARMQGPPPNYWTGSGTLPRVAQIKNVVIALYRIPKSIALWVPNELNFTHAWLPRDQFEETVEEEGWIFARLGDGYLALLSQYPYEWRDSPGEDQNRELIVDKPRNIWICEAGRKEVNGDFTTFIQKQLQAEVRFYDSSVSYTSPTQGQLQFGWKGQLRRDGRAIPLDQYPRYGNPYVQVDFPPEELNINLGEHRLYLNWLTGERTSSTFL
jgi:hypothetical protein